MDAEPAGPWDSVKAFHEHLLWRAGPLQHFERSTKSPEEIQDVIRRAHARQHRVCLTHNDLGAHNILVDDGFNITGIVDWENCAWMPEYWCVCCAVYPHRVTHASGRELTKATFLPQYQQGRWLRIMTAALPMYALEQEAESHILRHRTYYT